MCVYLAGAGGAAILAEAPLLAVAFEAVLMGAVAGALGPNGAHAVVAPPQVHTHRVVPAGVGLSGTLVHV